MQDFDFIVPRSLPEALAVLGDGARPVAGCTDVIPQMLAGRFAAGCLVDLSRLDELHGIHSDGEEIVIGACTTYAEMAASPLLQQAAPALVQAAQTVGCVQTRQRGTLGGNIANASPAGDTLPPLLVLEAQVELASPRGTCTLPLPEILLGPRRTVLASDELIMRIRFIHPAPGTRMCFFKLGSRQGMAVAVVSTAALLALDEQGRVATTRLALGAVAPTALRLPAVEALLQGQPPTPELIVRAAAAAAAACSPIDDVRATAAYRRHAVRVLTRRALSQLINGTLPSGD